MTQKYYYAFDSPNDSKFRHKSLNFRTLGWTVTPVKQLTASKKTATAMKLSVITTQNVKTGQAMLSCWRKLIKSQQGF